MWVQPRVTTTSARADQIKIRLQHRMWGRGDDILLPSHKNKSDHVSYNNFVFASPTVYIAHPTPCSLEQSWPEPRAPSKGLPIACSSALSKLETRAWPLHRDTLHWYPFGPLTLSNEAKVGESRATCMTFNNPHARIASIWLGASWCLSLGRLAQVTVPCVERLRSVASIGGSCMSTKGLALVRNALPKP